MFTLPDIGEAGRQIDAGIYNNSKLGMAIDRNLLNIPEPAKLLLRKFPLVFVAYEALALKPFLLRLFPKRNDFNFHKRVFNYRLSRARQVVKNTFGILASRFRIFRRSIIGKTGDIKSTTKADVILHNFLMRKST